MASTESVSSPGQGRAPGAVLLERPTVLLVFVDGLPFADADAALPAGWRAVPHRPALGYSVTIEAELFAGLEPADLEGLGEWNPGPLRPRWQRALLRLGALGRRNEYLDYAAHRAIERVLGERLYNLPLECLPRLHRNGRLPYDPEFPRETIFTRFGFELVRDADHLDSDDDDVVDSALEALAAGRRRLFVPLVRLDGISHEDGLRSERRDAQLARLRANVERLWAAVREADPGALGIVVSDHGFSDVERAVDLDVAGVIRRTGGPRGTLYTIESTLARVWCDDENQRAAVAAELGRSEHGVVLTAEQRERYGVGDRRFGDVIFVAHEGVIFVPCTMTKRTAAAGMHGYLPDLPSQWGVAAASEPGVFTEPVSSREFHDRLAT